MLFRNVFFSLIVLMGTVGPASAQPAPEAPRNVILFIADGCGPASFTFARDYLRWKGVEDGLAIDAMQVGSIHTFSTNSRVTDSAAAATAFACGVKTYNGAIAMDTLRQPVATVLEAAEARGMATGLVATSTITHATPASFSAHVPNRGMTGAIAVQQLEQGIEVLFGGGRADFMPRKRGGKRVDERDLFEEARAKGYQVILSRDEFTGDLRAPVLGLFSYDQMDFDIDRDPAQQPSLAEMTAKAIDLLKDDADGFFLMVEGSRIDHAAHANDAAAHLHDILAFDAAIAEALAFAREDGETLVISTSDHETGGLTLGRNIDGQPQYTWKPEVIDKIPASHGGLLTIARDERAMPCDLLKQVAEIECTEAEVAEFAKAIAGEANINFTTAEVISRRALVGWTSGGHTAVDVNLYAFGPGRDRFVGHHDNTAVGLLIAELMGFDLPAMTEAMRQAAGSR